MPATFRVVLIHNSWLSNLENQLLKCKWKKSMGINISDWYLYDVELLWKGYTDITIGQGESGLQKYFFKVYRLQNTLFYQLFSTKIILFKKCK